MLKRKNLLEYARVYLQTIPVLYITFQYQQKDLAYLV